MDSDRARGVLLGLACGDALGRPVEFKSASAISSEHGQLTEMVGYGTWNQPPGTITDDTDQALCIARSLVERETFDAADIAERFVAWYDSGPFDIGGMTRRALRLLSQGESWTRAGQQVWEQSPEGQNAGNGSTMRCPPLAIPYATDWNRLVRVSRQSSQITHYDPRCTYGCDVLNCTIAGFLQDDDDPLERALDRTEPDAPDELVEALRLIPDHVDKDQLSNSGYVVHTLQTALHDGLTANSAEDAIVTAVNRGGDTDTIGAVAGAVAGARFGASSLPNRWLEEINERDELEELAMALWRRPHSNGV